MPRIFEDTVRRLGNIVVSSDVFQNDILVMRYDQDYATRNDRAGRIYQHYLRAPSRMNALLFIGVISGSMELQEIHGDGVDVGKVHLHTTRSEERV